jgi:drug/metabolite transporter (DMT)-like permease
MKHRTALFCMALHVLFAAVNYVMAKAAAERFPSVEALTMTRAAASAVLLLALTGTLIPRPRFSGREWLQIAGLAALLVPINQYLFLKGLKSTAPGHAALLYATTPLGVLLLQSALARRAPSPVKALGVALGFVGVLIVMRPWDSSDPRFHEIRVGDAWIALGAVVWVVYTVAAGPLLRRHDPRTVTAWGLVVGAALLAPFAGRDLVEMDLAWIPAEAWWGLASLVVLASCVMMLLWNWLLRHLEPVEVSIGTNAQPVATVALTALLAAAGLHVEHKDLGAAFFVGTALVVAGVVLAQRRQSLPPVEPS